jgi:hypothetical protein
MGSGPENAHTSGDFWFHLHDHVRFCHRRFWHAIVTASAAALRELVPITVSALRHR